MALECYGLYHILCSRIALNTGIAYEDHRQYEQAYDCFKQSYEINIQVSVHKMFVKYSRHRLIRHPHNAVILSELFEVLN